MVVESIVPTMTYHIKSHTKPERVGTAAGAAVERSLQRPHCYPFPRKVVACCSILLLPRIPVNQLNTTTLQGMTLFDIILPNKAVEALIMIR
jgi:hypothetical protein